jgi:hypothetical protein
MVKKIKAKKNKDKFDISNLREREIGNAKEIVYQVSKKSGVLTIDDVKNLRAKFLTEAGKQYDNAVISLTKVLAGKWTSFKSEAAMNEYFESKVADPSKFYEFEAVTFYVILQ